MSKFGIRLKELRKERGYSQQELADLLNLSRSSIEMYEQGKRDPSTETKEAIADFFNVNMDYLFGRNKNGTASTEKISSDERELIASYASLNSAGKKRIREYMLFIAGQNEYKLKGEDLELSNKVG